MAVARLLQNFVFLHFCFHTIICPGYTKGCVCLGDTLTYDCTVMGSFGGATIWRGTALGECQPNNDEILLLHSRFTMSNGGNFGECNHGNVVGRSLGVEGSNYTSQLNVMVTSDVTGKNVMCINEATSSEIVQFSETITNTTDLLPPPNNILVSAVNFDSRALVFDWSPVTPDCPSLHYNILSSNCGSCPTTTTNTTVTCTDVPTNGTTCTFAVQTVVCGDIVGDLSDSVNLTTFFKVEDKATEIQGNLGSRETLILTTSLFATILFLWVIVSTTVIIVLARKAKVKVQEEYELPSTITTSTSAGDRERDLSAIDTSDNTAYGLFN